MHIYNALLNIYDLMFAHIVRRKARVLKAAPQVAAPGVESAVYDCLVSS